MGMNNGRLKDYFDLLFLADNFPFEGEVLVQAIRSTFGNRGLPIDSLAPIPIGLDHSFSEDQSKKLQWDLFLSRSGLQAPSLAATVLSIQDFLLPVLGSIREDRDCGAWPPGGPWDSAVLK